MLGFHCLHHTVGFILYYTAHCCSVQVHLCAVSFMNFISVLRACQEKRTQSFTLASFSTSSFLLRLPLLRTGVAQSDHLYNTHFSKDWLDWMGCWPCFTLQSNLHIFCVIGIVMLIFYSFAAFCLSWDASFSTDDDNDTEVEAVDVDTELNLVTECWVEPQSGTVMNCMDQHRRFQGLKYQEIPQAVCIAS